MKALEQRRNVGLGRLGDDSRSRGLLQRCADRGRLFGAQAARRVPLPEQGIDEVRRCSQRRRGPRGGRECVHALAGLSDLCRDGRDLLPLQGGRRPSTQLRRQSRRLGNVRRHGSNVDVRLLARNGQRAGLGERLLVLVDGAHDEGRPRSVPGGGESEPVFPARVGECGAGERVSSVRSPVRADNRAWRCGTGERNGGCRRECVVDAAERDLRRPRASRGPRPHMGSAACMPARAPPSSATCPDDPPTTGVRSQPSTRSSTATRL